MDLWGLLLLSATAGFLAFFSPCGFALLPAYVGFFMAQKSHVNVIEGLKLGLVISAGFIIVPAALWIFVALAGNALGQFLPIAALVSGIFLVIAGTVLLLRPQTFSLRLPGTLSASRSGYLGAFLFGLAYVLGGIGCVLPAFLAIISQAATVTPLAGLLVFLTFALTMTALMLLVTVSLVLAKRTIFDRLKKIMPLVYRLGAVLLIIAGVLLIARELPLLR